MFARNPITRQGLIDAGREAETYAGNELSFKAEGGVASCTGRFCGVGLHAQDLNQPRVKQRRRWVTGVQGKRHRLESRCSDIAHILQ